ncbi:sel1 repeat family protein [Rhizobium paknamense]|uniref:TPR repeat protein n=1 Tax=Rhizobium paknamense TaxID=1206817 RepID=A0ABU0I7L2_9HYPH|nr:sel1 repeat family protein [Rhizobium paknamense]MDQ0454218.1 TPR repeat protein [Rhizobium paknamense]
MAKLDMMTESKIAGKGESQADTYRVLGLMYATGKGCDRNLVAAHKWLNIAAIKGCDKAAKLRADLASAMRKDELAEALREAREWMTIH